MLRRTAHVIGGATHSLEALPNFDKYAEELLVFMANHGRPTADGILKQLPTRPHVVVNHDGRVGIRLPVIARNPVAPTVAPPSYRRPLESLKPASQQPHGEQRFWCDPGGDIDGEARWIGRLLGQGTYGCVFEGTTDANVVTKVIHRSEVEEVSNIVNTIRSKKISTDYVILPIGDVCSRDIDNSALRGCLSTANSKPPYGVYQMYKAAPIHETSSMTHSYRTLMEAVSAFNEAKLFHTDIKWPNVMLQDGRIKLIDLDTSIDSGAIGDPSVNFFASSYADYFAVQPEFIPAWMTKYGDATPLRELLLSRMNSLGLLHYVRNAMLRLDIDETCIVPDDDRDYITKHQGIWDRLRDKNKDVATRKTLDSYAVGLMLIRAAANLAADANMKNEADDVLLIGLSMSHVSPESRMTLVEALSIRLPSRHNGRTDRLGHRQAGARHGV